MKNKMNKGALHLMLALCTMGSLAACSSDDVLSNIKETDDAVKIAISTRNGDTGTTEDFWIENDRIALSAFEYQIATYQWNGSAWSPESILYWPNEQKCRFMGYYPTTATNDGLSFTIPTDQSDAAKLHAADYMTTDLYYVEKSSDPDKQLIDLNFYHRLAKVVINIASYGSEYDAAAPTLSDEKIISKGSGVSVIKNENNNKTSSVASTGNDVSIQPIKGLNAEGKPCYTALVSPTTLTKSSALIFITVDGVKLQFYYSGANLELKSGNTYTFNVTIGDNKVTLASCNIGSWESISGGSGSVEIL